jgi:4-amino-4-deoxy-L-arabinose transferase-like glycosyltransferase
MSSKIPPFVYLSTAPIISTVGKEPDRIILIFLIFSAILLGSVYGLGALLFTRRVGLWAAGFCVLMPVLYEARLEYLLDFPLTAMVALAFLALTLWRSHSLMAPTPDARLPMTLLPWIWAIAAGVAIGLALMTKQSAGLFLLVPLLWCGAETVWRRQWWRFAQFLVLVLATVPVWYPWYRTNWLLILTSSKRATIDSAAIQGSPSLLSLDAWTFYLRYLPWMVSVPLFMVSVLGLLLFWRRSRVGNQWRGSVDYEAKSKTYRQQAFQASQGSLLWLLVFLAGAYLLSTLNPNKDTRYFAPALPVLAVVLAYGMTLLPRSWRLLRWGSVALAALLMLSALFPLWGHVSLTRQRYPNPFFPNRMGPYPHADVIREVRQTSPYLRSTIGVLPSTPEVNQHNVNYFGLMQFFQVYGRQVGTRKATLTPDRRSLEWFLTKTGQQGSFRQPDLQQAMVQSVEQSGEFAVQKSWLLPDQSRLQLFHQRVPPIQVVPLEPTAGASAETVRLEKITVPAQVPPGQPIPITYQWVGPWQDLQAGLVILTWHRQGQPATSGRDRWLHDHGIGLGMLFPEKPKQVIPSTPFRVTERLAMLPPSIATPGTYELEAVYLNRKTGKTTPLTVPKVVLTLNPTAPAPAAPELDLLTQLRSLAGTLPKGPQSLERISNEINRINQYDPIQDYLTQSQQAMQYRLQTEPKNRTYAYTLALATVLKRQVNDAIAALENVTQLDPTNPYAYAYLGFVNLYDFRAGAAQQALNTARKLNPQSPEIQALSGIADLMRGNLVGAWQHAQAYQKAERLKG